MPEDHDTRKVRACGQIRFWLCYQIWTQESDCCSVSFTDLIRKKIFLFIKQSKYNETGWWLVSEGVWWSVEAVPENHGNLLIPFYFSWEWQNLLMPKQRIFMQKYSLNMIIYRSWRGLARGVNFSEGKKKFFFFLIPVEFFSDEAPSSSQIICSYK